MTTETKDCPACVGHESMRLIDRAYPLRDNAPGSGSYLVADVWRCMYPGCSYGVLTGRGHARHDDRKPRPAEIESAQCEMEALLNEQKPMVAKYGGSSLVGDAHVD